MTSRSMSHSITSVVVVGVGVQWGLGPAVPALGKLSLRHGSVATHQMPWRQ